MPFAHAADRILQSYEAIDKATVIISRFRLSTLMNARIISDEWPDTTNPSGYWHRWVYIEYRLLGVPCKKTLYFEATAFDESNQEAVERHAKNLLAGIKAVA